MKGPSLKAISANHGDQHKQVRIERDSPRLGTAQYNFIPVNDTVFCYPRELDPIRHDVYESTLYHGELECEITALSDVFIGDGNGKFFSVNGAPRIPGSTLRGLIRNMVTIMAYGKMSQIDSGRTLYTRPMADEDKSLRDWYTNELTSQESGETRKSYTASAGYLYHDANKGKYFIRPAEKQGGKQYTQVKIEHMQRDLNQRKLKPHEYYRRPDGGYYVTSGPAPNKKREWHIFPPDHSQPPVEVPTQTILDYEKDCAQANPSRKIKFNLLDILVIRKRDFEDGIPVIYKVRNGRIVTFGHTGLFRIAYEKSIGEHLPATHLDPHTIDLAERMFGRIVEIKNPDGTFTGVAHASFIQVTDALPVGKLDPGETRSVILSQPKPTSFQNYLVQVHTRKDGKNHWGQGTLLRGAKLYWHHSFKLPDYSAVKSEKMYKELYPIGKGSRFSFNIRFTNLTKLELGALITALQLPEGCAHKLGMAKALGLGSIRIEAGLRLLDPRQRYGSLFSDGTWKTALGETQDPETFAGVFRSTLARYCGKYDKDQGESFWDLYRMRQLKKMLSVSSGNQAWNKGSLKDQGFDTRKRKILPIPEDI